MNRVFGCPDGGWDIDWDDIQDLGEGVLVTGLCGFWTGLVIGGCGIETAVCLHALAEPSIASIGFCLGFAGAYTDGDDICVSPAKSLAEHCYGWDGDS